MMKKILYLIPFIIIFSNSLKCSASTGIWSYIENIELKPIIHEEIQVQPKQAETRVVEIPNHSGMKTWMPHHLFAKRTNQYVLQQYANTDKYGFRYINERYIVAVGTGANVDVGQYIDIVLENGEIIPAIIGDIKADNDTDDSNLTTVHSGCVCEFIVEKKALQSNIKRSGDVSTFTETWDYPIVEFIVYEQLNILEELNED